MKEEKFPEIASVTYDGAEAGEIRNGTKIEIKLTDPEVSQYQAQAVLKGRLYPVTVYAKKDGSEASIRFYVIVEVGEETDVICPLGFNRK